MIKFYFIRVLLFVFILINEGKEGRAQSTSSTDYFRSKSSGFWNSVNSWESSTDGSANWIAATMVPTEVANIITIRNGHTVTINSNTTIDQVIVANGGILEIATGASAGLTINDGAGNDIIIQNGGVFLHNVTGSQLPSFAGAATIEIQNSGMLEVANSNAFPSDYANTSSAISGNILWADSSVFNWNSSTSPADGVTYFPAASAVPIFRVSKPISLGNTTATVINGLLEANASINLQSTGSKTFRNGIVGAGTVAATAVNGGQFIVNGATAKLGGGILILNNNGLAINAATIMTLISNKTINNYTGATGTVALSGTLVCSDFVIDGNSKIQIDGTVKTTNTNGLTGSLYTTFATGFNVNSIAPSSTIEYNRTGDQTVTALAYGNLTISGSGLKKVIAQADVSVSGILNILPANTLALNGTNNLKLNGGGTLDINANAVFDNGGESQVSGGGSPTINIYGTFITRDMDGFSGTGTSIPGATSTTPTSTLNINAGSTVEYGRGGDQQVTARDDYKNLTFSGSGIKTIPTCAPFGMVTIKDNVIADASNKSFGDVNTNLTMTSGRLKVGGGGTKPDIGGTYNLTGGDIEFTNNGATPQAIRSPRSYFNIIISGSNVKNGAGIITIVSGGSFVVKSGGMYDNIAQRINGAAGTQTFTMEAGSTFKTNTTGGFSGSTSAAVNNIETINIDPKSTIIYSRSGDQTGNQTGNQTITPLTSYPTLLLKGSGIKTVLSGTVNIAATADSVVIDPSVVFKVNSGAKVNFNNRPVVVHSNAGGTGIIGEITDGSAALLNTANVTIERFIPAKRAFRFMSSPVTTTNSIKANWMEGQNNPPPVYSTNNNNNPGYGTHITGSSDPDNGFDATATNNPSLFTFNNGTQAWQPAQNTSSTLTAGYGYRLLVRGSRSVDLSNNAATPSNTTLRVTGTVRAGTVIYNGSSASSISGNINSYSFIGNPYASPVNWDALAKQGLSPYYSVWDPNLNTRGAYATYGNGITSPSGSQVDQNIQSGQAFFVQTNAANPSLTFNEPNKTIVNRNVFRTTSTPALAVQLLFNIAGESEQIADGVTLLYDDNFNAAINSEDAGKINNLDENAAIISNGKMLSIEGRPTVISSDTIQLHLTQFRQKNYYLKFSPGNFSSAFTALVKDNYLKKETAVDLNSETVLPFSISSDSASFSPRRFAIILRANEVLPLITNDIKAYKKEAGIQVEWVVTTETGIEKYEVEKSVDGRKFEKRGTAAVRGSRRLPETYSWYDQNVNTGNNFYRIKYIEKTGTIRYSNQVNIKIDHVNSSITVSPNPVTNNAFNILIKNMEKGFYNVGIYNNMGQKIYNGLINCNGTAQAYRIFAGKVIPKGNYKLQITNGNKTFVENIIFE